MENNDKPNSFTVQIGAERFVIELPVPNEDAEQAAPKSA
jgi:hypothetical protein